MQMHKQITKTDQEIVINESSWLPGENFGPLLLSFFQTVISSERNIYERVNKFQFEKARVHTPWTCKSKLNRMLQLPFRGLAPEGTEIRSRRIVGGRRKINNSESKEHQEDKREHEKSGQNQRKLRPFLPLCPCMSILTFCHA